ncbi:MAG: FAD-binding oxidoreductase, partial [Candidatus Thorarchaeota archaeon]
AALPSLAFQIIDNQFKIITQPQTISSLTKLVKYAFEHRIPIVPRGSGTSGWGGALPTHGGICISTLHMSKFVHIDEYRMLVTVEAGMTWKELLVFLEQIGLTLPVYPSSASAATIGGFAASGGVGIGSARYGDIRTQVAGIEGVIPNGMLVRLGEFALRENDGLENIADQGNKYLQEVLQKLPEDEKPEPMDLFLGLFGTFGIITRITLRVIPKLVLRTVVCIFDDIESLTCAIIDLSKETQPYYMRFITDTYTTKRFSPRSSIDEYGKFILTCAFLDTFYQIDEDLDMVKRIVEAHKGGITGEKRAQYHWDERLYPLRIKTLGPSLVPAEVIIPINQLPGLHKKIVDSIGMEAIAIEGTVSNDKTTSFLVWILDDERKKLSYTLGWHRSFDVASTAAKFDGLPYAVALWNVPYADEFYGKKQKAALKKIKSQIDPRNLMNPLKVFGGRVVAKNKSLSLGFILGYLAAIAAQIVAPIIPGFEFLDILLWSGDSNIPPAFLISLVGGVFGFIFMKSLTLRQALRIGIPALRIIRHLFRR